MRRRDKRRQVRIKPCRKLFGFKEMNRLERRLELSLDLLVLLVKALPVLVKTLDEGIGRRFFGRVHRHVFQELRRPRRLLEKPGGFFDLAFRYEFDCRLRGEKNELHESPGEAMGRDASKTEENDRLSEAVELSPDGHGDQLVGNIGISPGTFVFKGNTKESFLIGKSFPRFAFDRRDISEPEH